MENDIMKKAIKLEQFTRGRNPFKALNIGKRAQIENWFKTWASYARYEIDDNLNIKVKGHLAFNLDNIIFLPDNLHIEGYLDLDGTKIVSLPDNLHIEGNLYIEKTKITSLPDNLYVGKDLYMENTKITFLPDDLQVEVEIYKDF